MLSVSDPLVVEVECSIGFKSSGSDAILTCRLPWLLGIIPVVKECMNKWIQACEPQSDLLLTTRSISACGEKI